MSERGVTLDKMSEETNPNPRGFTVDNITFIDLGAVDAVFRNTSENFTLVYFARRPEPVKVTFSIGNHQALLKALEIYRSNR